MILKKKKLQNELVVLVYNYLKDLYMTKFELKIDIGNKERSIEIAQELKNWLEEDKKLREISMELKRKPIKSGEMGGGFESIIEFCVDNSDKLIPLATAVLPTYSWTTL